MRTLLVTFDYPPMVGGIASVMETLWRRAGDSGCVILAPGGRGAEEFDASHPIRTVRFPALGGDNLGAKLLDTLSAALWFAFLAIRYKPAVVIAGQIVRAGPMAYAWSVITRKPFYLWVYGGETDPSFTTMRWKTRFLHRVLRSARYLFTNSPYTTSTMREFGIPRSNLVEVTLGVDPHLEPRPKSPEFVDRLGLADKLVFLTVGRLIERKGVDMMLRALGDLDSQLPAWHYLVVSDGPYRGALEDQVVDLGLTGKVTFTGHVEAGELPIFYNLCDVFAMPNRAVAGRRGSSLSVEGFGMVFVDAAACAKPVIGGRSGGAVDAINDGVNGLLVDPTDLEDLKRAILRLADPEERNRMGAAGVAFAARFSWEQSADILRPYLEEIP